MRKYLLTTLLAAASAAYAVGTPANTTIANTAYLDLNDGTTTATITSNVVNVTVQQVYGLSITANGTTAAPGQTVTVTPGQTGTLTYTVTNTGNGTDSVTLAALTANATAQGGNVLGIYLDNTTGTVGSYDAGDAAVTSLSALAADASRTVFVRYTVPAGTTGGSAAGAAHQLNLQGTSVGDTGKTDTDNVGQISVGRVVDLGFGTTQSKTVAAGSSVTFSDTLTNTGNTTLTAAEITSTLAAVTVNGSTAITNAFAAAYTLTGPGGTFTVTNPSSAALEAVLDQAIGAGLAAGSAVTYSIVVTPDATPGVGLGARDGDKLTLTLEAYSPLTSGGGVLNSAAQGDPQGIITNAATVQRGVGSASKKVAACTTATTCPAIGAAGTASLSAKPGEYVVYYLTASNTGSGTLVNVRLKDPLPANFVPTAVGAATNMTGGTLKYSLDGTTWVTDVTTLSVTAASRTLHVAYENGGSSTVIDASDTFGAGKTLEVKIVGYIRNTGDTATGTATSTLTSSTTGLSY